MKKIKVYEYEKCSTCKNALKFLDKNGIEYEKVAIAEKPPTKAELKQMHSYVGEIKKLFNTSGLLYREMKISEKIRSLSEDKALELLSAHGMLVKRPFVLAVGAGAVGFKEEEWKKKFLDSRKTR